MNYTDVDRRRAYPWPFFVAMVANLLLFFSFQALFPTSPLYVVEVGGTPTDNGLVTWAFALAALLTRSLAGSLADRLGRKPVLVVGAVLLGSGPLLLTLASSLPVLFVVKAVHGVGLGCFTTVYQAFIADLLPAGRYGAGLALATIPPSAAMIAAPLFGEWMVETFDFRPSFLVFGAVGGAGLLTTLVLPGRSRGTVDPSSSSGGNVREALRQPGVRRGALGAALLALPFGAFIGFLPLLADARGLGGTGLVFTVYALASTLVRPLAGRAADRWSARRVTLAGLVLVGLAAAGMAAVASRLALMGLAALTGAGGAAASAALDTKVQSSVGQSLRGSAAAIEYTAFDLTIGFGSLGLGLLVDGAGYGVMYAVVGGVVLTGVLVASLVLRARPRRSD